MAARLILIEAMPSRASDGVTETVRLAGGGAQQPYFYGGAHWRAGIVQLPTFIASIDFQGGDFGTGGVPQAAELQWVATNAADHSTIANYYWPDASITVRIGDENAEGALPPVKLAGKVLSGLTEGGTLNLQLIDPAADLKKPLPLARYGGTGGLDGPAEWDGKIKRRVWGRVWNIAGEPIDKANNIYAFADPSHPILAIDAVRDKGAASDALTYLAWQGSDAATFAALQTAEAPRGGGVLCPSIASIKWWTQPAGELTADLRGETGAGYIETTADIVERIVAAAGAAPFAPGTIGAARTARPDAVGWVADSDVRSIAEQIEALLGNSSLLWRLNGEGQIVLRVWAWGAPVAAAQSYAVRRTASFRPVATRTLGYRRNETVMARGDLAAIVLAQDVSFPDGTTGDDLQAAVVDGGAKILVLQDGALLEAQTNEQARLSQLLSVATAETARIRDRGLAFPGPDGASAFTLIKREETQRQSADEVFAETFELLGAVNDAGNAFIIDDETVFVRKTEAGAVVLKSLTARFGENEAAIEQNSNVIATVNSTLAMTVSRLTTAEAAIETTQIAVTDLTGSLASIDTRLSAGEGSIESLQEVLADESGTVAKALLRVGVGGRVIGFSAYNDGTTGNFIVSADKFALEDPDTGFRYFEVDDTGKATLREVEVDTVKARAITGTAMNQGAMGVAGYFFDDRDFTVPTSWSTVSSVTITPAFGKPILITSTAIGRSPDSSSTPGYIRLVRIVDGVTTVLSGGDTAASRIRLDADGQSTTLNCVDGSVQGQSTTYAFQCRRASSGERIIYASRFLVAAEQARMDSQDFTITATTIDGPAAGTTGGGGIGVYDPNQLLADPRDTA